MRVRVSGLTRQQEERLQAALAAEGCEAASATDADVTLMFESGGQAGPEDTSAIRLKMRELPGGIPHAAVSRPGSGRGSSDGVFTVWHAPLALEAQPRSSWSRACWRRAWTAHAGARAVARFVAAEEWLRAPALPIGDGQEASGAYSAIRRLIDIAFAIGVLLALGWLLGLLWLLVRATSPGPGIFAQTRLGRHQRPFTLYKLRSMRAGTRDMGTHEASADVVTGVGRFLRGTKLDELPQIINMLRGELTLIGPRPGLPMQSELSAERQKRGVFDVTPGLTGLAQVQGIDMSDPVRLAAVDAEYARLQSLALDARIALATVKLYRFSRPA
jgi:lipopolysaccharide/colanic/teichoic acid biosynthesis glycosyltransferase